MAKLMAKWNENVRKPIFFDFVNDAVHLRSITVLLFLSVFSVVFYRISFSILKDPKPLMGNDEPHSLSVSGTLPSMLTVGQPVTVNIYVRAYNVFQFGVKKCDVKVELRRSRSFHMDPTNPFDPNAEIPPITRGTTDPVVSCNNYEFLAEIDQIRLKEVCKVDVSPEIIVAKDSGVAHTREITVIRAPSGQYDVYVTAGDVEARLGSVSVQGRVMGMSIQGLVDPPIHVPYGVPLKEVEGIGPVAVCAFDGRQRPVKNARVIAFPGDPSAAAINMYGKNAGTSEIIPYAELYADAPKLMASSLMLEKLAVLENTVEITGEDGCADFGDLIFVGANCETQFLYFASEGYLDASPYFAPITLVRTESPISSIERVGVDEKSVILQDSEGFPIKGRYVFAHFHSPPGRPAAPCHQSMYYTRKPYLSGILAKSDDNGIATFTDLGVDSNLNNAGNYSVHMWSEGIVTPALFFEKGESDLIGSAFVSVLMRKLDWFSNNSQICLGLYNAFRINLRSSQNGKLLLHHEYNLELIPVSGNPKAFPISATMSSTWETAHSGGDTCGEYVQVSFYYGYAGTYRVKIILDGGMDSVLTDHFVHILDNQLACQLLYSSDEYADPCPGGQYNPAFVSLSSSPRDLLFDEMDSSDIVIELHDVCGDAMRWYQEFLDDASFQSMPIAYTELYNPSVIFASAEMDDDNPSLAHLVQPTVMTIDPYETDSTGLYFPAVSGCYIPLGFVLPFVGYNQIPVKVGFYIKDLRVWNDTNSSNEITWNVNARIVLEDGITPGTNTSVIFDVFGGPTFTENMWGSNRSGGLGYLDDVLPIFNGETDDKGTVQFSLHCNPKYPGSYSGILIFFENILSENFIMDCPPLMEGKNADYTANFVVLMMSLVVSSITMDAEIITVKNSSFYFGTGTAIMYKTNLRYSEQAFFVSASLASSPAHPFVEWNFVLDDILFRENSETFTVQSHMPPSILYPRGEAYEIVMDALSGTAGTFNWFISFAPGTKYERIWSITPPVMGISLLSLSVDVSFSKINQPIQVVSGMEISIPVNVTVDVNKMEDMDYVIQAHIVQYPYIEIGSLSTTYNYETFPDSIRIGGNNSYMTSFNTSIVQGTAGMYVLRLSAEGAESNPIFVEFIGDADVVVSGVTAPANSGLVTFSLMHNFKINETMSLYSMAQHSNTGQGVPNEVITLAAAYCGGANSSESSYGTVVSKSLWTCVSSSLTSTDNTAMFRAYPVSVSNEEGYVAFSNLALIGGHSGSYVFLFLSSNFRILGLSLPFELTNPVKHVSVINFPRKLTVPAALPDMKVLVQSSDGSPLEEIIITVDVHISECRELTRVCRPLDIPSRNESWITGTNGMFSFSNVYISGGSTAKYGFKFLGAGISSDTYYCDVTSAVSLDTSELASYQMVAVILLLLFIPQFMGNTAFLNEKRNLYQIIILFTGAFSSIIFFLYVLIASLYSWNHASKKEKEFSTVGYDVMFTSVIIVGISCLLYVIMTIVSTICKKQTLFYGHKLSQSRKHVSRLLWEKRPKKESAAEMELGMPLIGDDSERKDLNRGHWMMIKIKLWWRRMFPKRWHSRFEKWRDFVYPQRMMVACSLSFLCIGLVCCFAYLAMRWILYYLEVAYTIYVDMQLSSENSDTSSSSLQSTAVSLMQQKQIPSSSSEQHSPFSDMSGLPLIQQLLLLIFLNQTTVNMDDIVVYVKMAFFYGIIVALTFSLLLTILSWILMLLNFRKRCMKAREGKYFFLPEHFSCLESTLYVGNQVSAMLFAFVICTFFLFVTLVTFVLLYILSESFREWLANQLFWFLLSLFLGTILVRLLLFLIGYTFLARNRVIMQRRMFAWFDFGMLAFGLLRGLASALWYFLKGYFLMLIYLSRLDYPKAGENDDPGYCSYVGMFLMETSFNNPVLLQFCYFLTHRDRSVTYDRRRIVRNRFFVWITLLRNPKLKGLRKCALQFQKHEEDEIEWGKGVDSDEKQ